MFENWHYEYTFGIIIIFNYMFCLIKCAVDANDQNH